MSVMPVNRMLLVSPIAEEEEKVNILLPDDYKTKSPFARGVILEMAGDCGLKASKGDNIVFDNSMLQEINVSGETYYLLLENYVMGILKNEDKTR